MPLLASPCARLGVSGKHSTPAYNPTNAPKFSPPAARLDVPQGPITGNRHLFFAGVLRRPKSVPFYDSRYVPTLQGRRPWAIQSQAGGRSWQDRRRLLRRTAARRSSQAVIQSHGGNCCEILSVAHLRIFTTAGRNGLRLLRQDGLPALISQELRRGRLLRLHCSDVYTDLLFPSPGSGELM